jgi:hypothetical protein
MGVGGQRHALAALLPERAPVPILQEAGWAAGPVWTGTKISLLPGLEPQTFQPVASHYTDCAILINTGKSCTEIFFLLNILYFGTKVSTGSNFYHSYSKSLPLYSSDKGEVTEKEVTASGIFVNTYQIEF